MKITIRLQSYDTALVYVVAFDQNTIVWHFTAYIHDLQISAQVLSQFHRNSRTNVLYYQHSKVYSNISRVHIQASFPIYSTVYFFKALINCSINPSAAQLPTIDIILRVT